MTTTGELKQQANNLRKSGNLIDALHIYRILWEESSDKFDGAGFLHCLRKLKLFDEALPLADELLLKYKDFNWCKIEITWTYIEGILEQFGEKEPLENVLLVANKILSLQPEDIALRKVVFSTLKFAKNTNKWDIINEWVSKVDPSILSKNPILENKREGWSYYTLWYNYKINALIKLGLYSKAIELLNLLLPEIPYGQQKFFIRLEALTYYLIGEYDKAELIYSNLCKHPKADWWLLHEYAKVLKNTDNSTKALSLMYQAAASNPKIESMVTLFLDISILSKENNNLENSRNHLYLTLYVREKQEWKVTEELLSQIIYLNKEIGNDNKPKNLFEALKLCKEVWNSNPDSTRVINNTVLTNPKKAENLIGNVRIGKNENPFCFIYLPNGESIFCYKSELPANIKENDTVLFDSIRSFDKKKNTQSWKAINVRFQNI
ncbi:tetratricopeptide repeat protein [Paenibacillus sp. sgz500992]|uniref:tetratricopeptide repeat protein n=1 Tax=Paenibacillus sp. sgz500992 TaxID=3242476 RepID=UPI0036D42FCF